jgi:hypothetical protein
VTRSKSSASVRRYAAPPGKVHLKLSALEAAGLPAAPHPRLSACQYWGRRSGLNPGAELTETWAEVTCAACRDEVYRRGQIHNALSSR